MINFCELESFCSLIFWPCSHFCKIPHFLLCNVDVLKYMLWCTLECLVSCCVIRQDLHSHWFPWLSLSFPSLELHFLSAFLYLEFCIIFNEMCCVLTDICGVLWKKHCIYDLMYNWKCLLCCLRTSMEWLILTVKHYW